MSAQRTREVRPAVLVTGVRTRAAGRAIAPPVIRLGGGGGGGGGGGRAPLIFRLLYKPGGGAHPLRFALFFFICCHNQG